MPRVFIPYVLRKLTRGQREVEVSGDVLGQVIDNLEQLFPGFKDKVVRDGEILPGLAIVCGNYPTRRGLLEPVGEDTEIHFVHAVSGGEAA